VLFELVRYIVERHAPDFANLFCYGDAASSLRAEAARGAATPMSQRAYRR
jgi:hypothetical protein